MEDATNEIRETEPIDRIPSDPSATRWRQAARNHQHRLREANGWPVGVHNSAKGSRPVGSKVDASFAEEHHCNFFTQAAVDAVVHRLSAPARQKHETLDEKRLWGDLLSSMPMCFNLFGPLWADPALAAAVAHRWFPRMVDAQDRVILEFEWSPGRLDRTWLGDRTAFDAVLHIDGPRGRRLIGIETKYHEYPTAPARRPPDRPKNPRYGQVSERAGLFLDPASQMRVPGSKLEQIWRDHLLALACVQGPAGPVEAMYVLAAPAANSAWSRLAFEYVALLQPPAAKTFEYRSIDELLEQARDLLPHTAAFEARYLAVDASGGC